MTSTAAYEMSASDHAFEAFLAGCRKDSFTGEEAAMFRFFATHPGQSMYRAVEAAIAAYTKEKQA